MQSRGLQLPKEAFPTADAAAQGCHIIIDDSTNVKPDSEKNQKKMKTRFSTVFVGR